MFGAAQTGRVAVRVRQPQDQWGAGASLWWPGRGARAGGLFRFSLFGPVGIEKLLSAESVRHTGKPWVSDLVCTRQREIALAG